MILTIVANFWESSFRKNRVVLLTSAVSILLIAVMWIGLTITIAPLRNTTQTGVIPLHYNLYFGIDAFGPWYAVYALSGLATFVFFINTLLAYFCLCRSVSLPISYWEDMFWFLL